VDRGKPPETRWVLQPPFRQVTVCSLDILRCVDRTDHLILAHLASNAHSPPNTLLGHMCSLKKYSGRKPSPAQERHGREALSRPPQLEDMVCSSHTTRPCPSYCSSGSDCTKSRETSHPSLRTVSSVRKHCLAASRASRLSSLLFDLGAVQRQEQGRHFLGVRTLLRQLRHQLPKACVCLELNGMGERVSKPAHVEQ